jgi:hypothetical protein
MLQEAGAIEYRRGQLHVRRREILEQAVCECYKLMRAEFNRTPQKPTNYSVLSL